MGGASRPGDTSQTNAAMAFALNHAPPEHRELNHGEQNNRAHARRQRDIGIGKQSGVSEQGAAARPAAVHAPVLQATDQEQNHCAAYQPDKREAACANIGSDQAQPTQHRIGGKGNHDKGRD